MTGRMDVTVHLSSGRELSFEQSIVLELTRDDRGYLRIRSIREVPLARDDLPELPDLPLTWTRLLARFRPPTSAYTDPARVLEAHVHSLEVGDFNVEHDLSRALGLVPNTE